MMPFSKAIESTLNAFDVTGAPGELMSTVLDSEVLRVADINEAVIATPLIHFDYAGEWRLPLTFFSNATADFEKNHIDALARQTS